MPVILLVVIQPLPVIVGLFEEEPILQLVEICFDERVRGGAARFVAGRIGKLVGVGSAAFNERTPAIEMLQQHRVAGGWLR